MQANIVASQQQNIVDSMPQPIYVQQTGAVYDPTFIQQAYIQQQNTGYIQSTQPQNMSEPVFIQQQAPMFGQQPTQAELNMQQALYIQRPFDPQQMQYISQQIQQQLQQMPAPVSQPELPTSRENTVTSRMPETLEQLKIELENITHAHVPTSKKDVSAISSIATTVSTSTITSPLPSMQSQQQVSIYHP
jgi:hypothetical protein